MSGGRGSAAGLAASLLAFVAVGAAAALFLWRGLNEILEGRSPPASVWVVVLVAAVVLILIAYGPFLIGYLPGRFLSPGFKIF